MRAGRQHVSLWVRALRPERAKLPCGLSNWSSGTCTPIGAVLGTDHTLSLPVTPVPVRPFF